MYLINGHSLKQQQDFINYGFNNTYFTFKDNNPNNVIDGDIFYPLADALYRQKKYASHSMSQESQKRSLRPYHYIPIMGKTKIFYIALIMDDYKSIALTASNH